ncbi:MAG: sigma-70 family RNA polymerase sigma factor [Candidatus Pedobacter colombiensis]|uniref:Sigma-70 family RNA polymerase sigma factor n=1 Tax=Candidatus Pedobacter colombiensis TaxID=3121371 RepID=A0AAJ6B8V0_9SPHI|nr:sigma-70 family RNA polymerase sigma factor [Pedobacter sp.]WEK20866.1 MAG: sigma-70 family RNA polymerase sigma factor [Pedobacter sp.]
MEESLIANNSAQLQKLYNSYADMLFGYIFEVVNDRIVAETCLLNIFCQLSKELESKRTEEISTWAQVFRFAKDKLPTFNDGLKDPPPHKSEPIKYKELHPCLSGLNDEQRKIFCDSYYYGKTIAAISIELNQPEVSIRKSLREAFAIIKTGSGN